LILLWVAATRQRIHILLISAYFRQLLSQDCHNRNNTIPNHLSAMAKAAKGFPPVKAMRKAITPSYPFTEKYDQAALRQGHEFIRKSQIGFKANLEKL
jgi:hypothetical protein